MAKETRDVRAWPLLLVDGEALVHLGGEPMDVVLGRYEKWARGVLVAANLPGDMRPHRWDGESWVLVTDSDSARDGWSRVTGLVDRGTTEWFAANLLSFAEYARWTLEKGDAESYGHCVHKVTQFAHLGMFIERAENDALSGYDRREVARRTLGEARAAKESAAADRSERWIEIAHEIRKVNPTLTQADLARRVEDRVSGTQYKGSWERIRKVIPGPLG